MESRDVDLERPDDTPAVVEDGTEKKDWQEPTLTFVEPALTNHGPLTEVTGQFFGAFSPPQD